MAIGVLGYETIRRFNEPYAVQGSVVALVAGIGIVINSISAFLFYKSRKQDLNVKSAYLHLLADALVSAGVVAAGIVISFTGWYLLDPLIGLIVLIVILAGTWGLLTDSLKLSVDAVPSGIAHVRLDDTLDFIQKMNVIKEIKHQLKHENIRHSTIEMEAKIKIVVMKTVEN